MDNRKSSPPAVGGNVATVFVAIELSGKEWLTGLQSPRQERPGRHKLAAADGRGLWSLIERERSALQRVGWRKVRVVTCYEAGRDGFWLHRFLMSQGAESFVVDPGSILVNRRARRAKSDRLDVESLLRVVIRHDAGDCSLGRMVVVPTIAEEDARRPGRERQRLLSERTAHESGRGAYTRSIREACKIWSRTEYERELDKRIAERQRNLEEHQARIKRIDEALKTKEQEIMHV